MSNIITLTYNPDKFDTKALLFRSDLNELFANTGTFLSPTFTNIATARLSGEVIMYGGTEASIPASWKLCDGQGLDTTTFANLFAIIGYEYGGSGATFNVPNFKSGNRFPRGAINDAGRGETGGLASVTLTTSQMPVHTHAQNAHNHAITDPGHTHTYDKSAINDTLSGGPDGGSISVGVATGSSTTGITIDNATATNQNAGSGTSHENKPPYLDIQFIIKT